MDGFALCKTDVQRSPKMAVVRQATKSPEEGGKVETAQTKIDQMEDIASNCKSREPTQ